MPQIKPSPSTRPLSALKLMPPQPVPYPYGDSSRSFRRTLGRGTPASPGPTAAAGSTLAIEHGLRISQLIRCHKTHRTRGIDR